MVESSYLYFEGPSLELIVKKIKVLAGEFLCRKKFVSKDKYEPAKAQNSKSPVFPRSPVLED